MSDSKHEETAAGVDRHVTSSSSKSAHKETGTPRSSTDSHREEETSPGELERGKEKDNNRNGEAGEEDHNLVR